MQRRGKVYSHSVFAGILEEDNTEFRFTYEQDYVRDPACPPVSLTLPKKTEPYVSKTIFPSFFGLLAEGTTKEIQCRKLKLDENDHFGRLLKTAHSDVIGSVTVVEEA